VENDPVSSRNVVLLGSTGSIGTQAVDVVRRNPDRFRITGIGAGGGKVDTLATQAVALGVDAVGVANPASVPALRTAITDLLARKGRRGRVPEILSGPTAMAELASRPCDVVLNGVVGSLGLAPTLAALRAGRVLALANKESLVAGGPLVRAAIQYPGQIVPVDSEHSALAQCLRSGTSNEVSRLIVTASGGPFRGRAREELSSVTPAQALAHPTWDMGTVVSINSATLVNKALEVIEAHELFRVEYDRIEVVVHPQSVIHSMVEFIDGSTVAQCSPPDMRLPIALGLGWPERVPAAAGAVDWSTAHTWELMPLDETVFPAVSLAKAAGVAGRCRPAVFNAANEECVAAFVTGELPFLGIVDTIETVLAETPDFSEPGTVEDVLVAEAWARVRAREVVSDARKGA
jgi:1-deoxy-D-xylulose-5-phosphate reductoisomerase